MLGKPLILLLCLSATVYVADAQIFDLAKAIGTTALYIYEKVSAGKKLYDKYTAPKELNTTEAYLSLKESLDEIKEKLTELRVDVTELTQLQDRLYEMRSQALSIDDDYNEYYAHFFSDIKFADAEIKKFLMRMIDRLPAKIQDFHNRVLKLDVNNLITKMQKYSEFLNPSTVTGQSEQRYFYDMYLLILTTELKVGFILDISFKYLQKYSSEPVFGQTEYQISNVYKRIDTTVNMFKNVLSKTNRDLWKDDPKKAIEGETYLKLDNLYRWMFYNAEDFSGIADSCTFCPILTNSSAVTVAKCHDKRNCVVTQRKCANVVQCTSLQNSVQLVCPTENKNGSRYSQVREHKFSDLWEDWYLTEVPKFLGIDKLTDCKLRHEKFSSRPKSTSQSSGRYVGVQQFETCEACKCICDETTDSDRFFSLKRIVSNVHENKVITGVKFIKQNNTIVIQVQQAKMLRGGSVSGDARWKPLDKTPNTPQNTYELNWHNKRKISLDDIELSKDFVITGIRFFDDKNSLGIDVRATRFDNRSGELDSDSSYWISSKRKIVPKRTKLGLEKYNIPTEEKVVNKPINVTNQYIEFTPSNFSLSNAGQDVIPFIDMQPVVTKPPTALGGFKLAIKRAGDSGGYLMMLLRTYNVLHYF